MQIEQESPRRQEIIDAAVKAFAQYGYHGASMEDIAQMVGVKKRALYYYFPSKDELLFVILQHYCEAMIEDLESILPTSDRPTEKLREAFGHHLAALANHVEWFSVFLNEAKYLEEPHRKQIIALRDRYEQLIRRLIVEGMDRGELRPLNPKLVGFTLLGVINWMFQWYRPDESTPEELASALWDIVYEGIAASHCRVSQNGA